MQTVVIIGGDAAGMSAASKIKRELKEADVIVYERGEHISFSACGMPYWIGGTIESDEDLLVLTPEVARKKRGIDVRMRHEVTAIKRADKTVEVRNLDTGGTSTQDYDKLVIATGASAVRPPIPGMDLPGVFTLRALSDSQRIHAYMDASAPKTAVVIGAGYIGVEMAEALIDRGLEVHVVEMLPQIMPNFDEDMVGEVTEHLVEKGVHLHMGVASKGVSQEEERLAVALGDGKELFADLVIVSVGVRPNSQLAADAGLALGKSKAIRVDDHMRTNDPDIYAAGDCVEHHHIVLDEDIWIPLAPSANKGGRIAGENISDSDTAFPGILGTAVVKVFDYTMSVTGLTERAAIASGKFGADGEFVGSAVISASDKAHYWPGAEKIKAKLVIDRRNGKILGGQLVGKAGVNKRIDIVATAITAGLTVDQLGLLDLSYAPPYSPVYDPVQVCANVVASRWGRDWG
jgi:NADPH-dependent 2,4-dienoyl-CoA reductase/sulfur reductase-like enzyme